MKYLCMGYNDANGWAGVAEAQRRAIEEQSQAYLGELQRKGHLVDGRMLHQGQATTLRFERGGKGAVLVTDGPFAETKEQLGGVIVLEADDLNHAIRLMSAMPCARMSGSTMEIRPIKEGQGQS